MFHFLAFLCNFFRKYFTKLFIYLILMDENTGKYNFNIPVNLTFKILKNTIKKVMLKKCSFE